MQEVRGFDVQLLNHPIFKISIVSFSAWQWSLGGLTKYVNGHLQYLPYVGQELSKHLWNFGLVLKRLFISSPGEQLGYCIRIKSV
jgi:hypothetical protein